MPKKNISITDKVVFIRGQVKCCMIWPRVSGPDRAATLDVTKGGGVGGLSATTGLSSGVK